MKSIRAPLGPDTDTCHSSISGMVRACLSESVSLEVSEMLKQGRDDRLSADRIDSRNREVKSGGLGKKHRAPR